MEQKQLDEMEETFSGEEFLDETDLDADLNEADLSDSDNPEEVKIEAASKAKKQRKMAKRKELAREKENEWLEIDQLEEKRAVKETKKEAAREDKAKKTIPLVNPWEDEKEKEGGMFREVSTWQAITGIAIILLIFSIFSSGFHFTGAAVGDTLSSAEAENKALEYVNANFLREPFLAEVVSSEEVGNLYQVTLSVAGLSLTGERAEEKVETYITKDGSLFFPQGFDTSLSLQEQLLAAAEPAETPLENTEEELEEAQETVEEVIINPYTQEVTVNEVPLEGEDNGNNEEEEAEVLEEESEEAVVEEPAAVLPATRGFTLTAKKWLFSPHKLTVKRGDKVVLTINPDGLDFTFALPGYGISKEISGRTMLEFTANKAGTYEFLCSSCEEWRGMTGTLVVE